MFQLLQPIWMYTATAMAIPLAIHLWNVRKGKRLKVGSLSLIRESVQKKARQLRITEWLLLLLRCLLILLLALFLSQPVWHRQTAQEGKGWVLIPRESIDEVYHSFQTEIDGLLEQGYEFHYFNYPFDKASLSATRQDSTGSRVSYWQRIAQLNQLLPAAWPVRIYTPAGISHFAGAKPATDISITWKTNGIAQQTNTATSSPPMHVTLYHDNAHKEDARYVSAALETIRSLLQPTLVIHETNEPVTIGGQDWVIWLSDKMPAYQDSNAVYLVYAGGQTVSGNSPLLTKDHSNTVDPVMIYKRIAPGNNPYKLLWTDGYGNPILKQDAGNKRLLLYTRFDPDWNGLVWDASFPERLYRILQPAEPLANDRQIDTTQLVFTPVKNDKKTASGRSVPLVDHTCWLLLACLVTERWLYSYKRKTDAV